MPILLVLFIFLPIIEMVILIKVGGMIGAINTIGLVLLTAMLGAALLRKQGLDTLLRANRRLESGELPTQELFEGLALAAGGALLLTPGFVTDTIGLMLLLPPTRRWIIARVLARMTVTGNARMFRAGFPPHPAEEQERSPSNIIEGDFRREE